MSAAPQHTPPPDRYFLPLLTTVAYLATVIAVFGFISLLIDRDVIDEPDAGPLLGPVIVAIAAAITLRALVRLSGQPRQGQGQGQGAVGGRVPWSAAAGAAASVYAGMLLVGALIYAWARGEPLWLLFFAVKQAASPFIIAAALLSGLFVIGFWAMAGRPRVDPRAPTD